MSALLLIAAVALFALRGFGLVHDHPHFIWSMVGLACFAAAFLELQVGSLRRRP